MIRSMHIQTKLLLAITTVLLSTCLFFSLITYRTQRDALLEGIDTKLLTAAESAKDILGGDYHDRIFDSTSVTPQEFESIVGIYNKLCLKTGLQYIWSVIVLDNKIRFTTATSPSKDPASRDYASFLEIHSNPEAFADAFSTMRTTHSSFSNNWGEGRMVLIPDYDKHGRKYCFGASVDMSEVKTLLRQTALRTAMLSSAVLALGVLLSLLLARSLSRPIADLTALAKRIAEGDFDQYAAVGGSAEIASLSQSISLMSGAICDKIEELEDSRENLTITLNSIGDAVIATDLRGSIVRMNPVAEKLTGWSAAEAAGKPLDAVFKIHSSLTGGMVENPVSIVLAQNRVVSLANHTSLTARNGTVRQIADSGAPIRNAHGMVVGVVLVFRDVTEHYAAEAERRRLVNIMESTTDLVSVATPDGRVVYLNAAGKKMLGWHQGKDSTYGPIARAHPQEHARLIEEVGIPAAKRDGTWSGESILLSADGTQIPVSQVIIAHYSPSGEVEYLSTVIRDISEQKQQEEDRLRLEAQLRQAQKMEVLGTLAGGIAHDFNNILAPILGYAEIAQRDLPQESPLQAYLEQVRLSAKRGADLVAQILYFSGQGDRPAQPLRLESVIDDTLKLLRATLPATIDLKSDISPHCGPVMGDATQLHQVLMNLGTNAFQAIGEKNGTIEIRLEPVDVDEAFSRIHPQFKTGPYVRLSLRDSGCGMDSYTIEHAFEPFFTTKGAYKGTGLGLAVVHGIINKHQGQVIVDSELGKGSTFSVYLPMLESAQIEEAQHAGELPLGSGRILVIDDEEDVCSMAREMLERLGYEVTSCTKVEEAITLVNSDPTAFQLIITDRTMPVMTGPQLIEKLLTVCPNMPFIIMSGYSEEDSLDAAGRSEIRHYLRKPFGIHEIGFAVKQILSPSE